MAGPASPTSPPPGRLVRRRRVLVADNSDDMTRVLGELLSLEPDLEVVGFAPTGADALKRARQDSVDVIVLDLGLADGSGFDVLEALRAEHLPVKAVVYTGQSSAAVIARATDLGAAFVVKGEDIDALISAIRAA